MPDGLRVSIHFPCTPEPSQTQDLQSQSWEDASECCDRDSRDHCDVAEHTSAGTNPTTNQLPQLLQESLGQVGMHLGRGKYKQNRTLQGPCRLAFKRGEEIFLVLPELVKTFP